MAIAILGATGMTGAHLIEYALSRGRAVRALVRDRSRATLPDDVELIEGDALRLEDLATTFEGCSAVVSALGPTNRSWKMARARLCARVTQNILQLVAEGRAPSRYIMLSSASIVMPDDRRNLNGYLTRFVGPLILGPILTDKRQERKALLSSDAHWTMVRAPEVVDGPGSGKARFETGTHSSMKVYAGDVAQVMIDQIDSNSSIGKGIFVSADLSGRYGDIWGTA